MILVFGGTTEGRIAVKTLDDGEENTITPLEARFKRLTVLTACISAAR